MAKFAKRGDVVAVLVVAGHLPPIYTRADYEKTVEEANRAFEILGVSESRFLEIPATMIGEEPVSVVNGKIAGMMKEFEPHIVLCPFPDRHIDHRVVFKSVIVATRPVGTTRGIELLAAYETLSETHWNAPHMEPTFVPNWIVDITQEIDQKIDALRCYESQIQAFPGARSLEATEALAKLRGTYAGCSFGEGFQVIRMTG